MNTVELETFLAVANHASVSAAANELHLTQPAVSKRIQSLEQTLGTPLFDRIGKKLHVTEAGKMFAGQAELVLSLWADTERKLHALTDEVAGTLSIATSHHIGLHRLAPALQTFTQRYPDVHLNLSFEDSEIAHGQVRHGEVELAVATLDPKGAPDLDIRPIWDDPLVFVHKTSGAPSLHELAEQPCVLPGTGTYTGRIVLERFAQAGINLEPTMSTNYLETLSMLVSVGLGWSVLPLSMSDELEVLDVPGEPMHRTLGAIVNPHRAMSNASRAFLEVLESYREFEI
ncbi:MAG: LysR family transcriptional regulator [Pseudomonadales bacterium]|nr:LysR family transcriptional regulator [Pseudomonadales bacterium]